jgi:hypothetical protein
VSHAEDAISVGGGVFSEGGLQMLVPVHLQGSAQHTTITGGLEVSCSYGVVSFDGLTFTVSGLAGRCDSEVLSCVRVAQGGRVEVREGHQMGYSWTACTFTNTTASSLGGVLCAA